MIADLTEKVQQTHLMLKKCKSPPPKSVEVKETSKPRSGTLEVENGGINSGTLESLTPDQGSKEASIGGPTKAEGSETFSVGGGGKSTDKKSLNIGGGGKPKPATQGSSTFKIGLSEVQNSKKKGLRKNMKKQRKN